MNSRLLTIIFSGLATVAGLFLLSSTPSSSQQALILNPVTSSPVISLTPSSSPRSTFNKTATPLPTSFTTPIITPTFSPSTLTTTAPTPSTTSIITPNTPSPTSTAFPTNTPFLTASASPSQSTAPSPTYTPPPSGHTFYTSSHWKSKYYYCDTDNDWKNLSATYLKSFSSEQELLTAYPRTLHKPCQN